MAAEKTVKLLWDCADALNVENHTKKLLKSYYLTTCRKIAKHNIQMPREKFAMSRMCPRCCCFWNENEFEMKLRPQGAAHNAKTKKLIAKLEEAKGTLTRKQRQRAKWLRKRTSSNMEIRCNYCQHKSVVPLEKPKSKDKVRSLTLKDDDAMVQSIVDSSTTKKKVKKKNKTAGLKIEKTIMGKSKVQIKNVKESKSSPSKPNTTTPGPITVSKKSKISNASAVTSSLSSNLSQTLKSTKRKKKKNPNQVATTQAPSKTQQKNSLLQLAALLKTQSQAKSEANSTQKRLQSLLK